MTYTLDQSAFMTTYSGREFRLYNPSPDQIDIGDIAHALSMLCRFTGHVKRFYSVAQHCWHASFCVPEAHALEALLHDAAEAYINDLSRPLKHNPHMQGYLDVEHKIDQCVRQHFGLPLTPTPCIKDADNRLVVTEAKALMDFVPWTDGLVDYPHLVIPDLSPSQAERRFISRFEDLQVVRKW